MPKIRQPVPPSHAPTLPPSSGCRISGELRLADGRAFEGTVIFAPATAGFYHGRMIGVATTAVEVSGGIVQATLPPSLNALGRQVMGRYRWWTRPSGLSGWLDVPDEAEATLAGLWDRGMFCIDGAE